MSNQVLSFNVGSLITDLNRYCVPMYQRNYAWGEAEIHQLIQDVLDLEQTQHGSDTKQPYYIGTLVVFVRADGSFEIIDGQQRFTTLTLMAICLKRLANAGRTNVEMDWFSQPNLVFESREKSSHTLARLMQGIALDKLHNTDCNQDLLIGFALLEKRLLALGSQLNKFCHYVFKQVQITRVRVPEDTDLNHYFEVMNSRGEQLEKHEVVKARLMSVLQKIEDETVRDASLNALSRVWDAASNMERYIQYGFTTTERHKLFGKDWGQLIPENFDGFCASLGAEKNNNTQKTLHTILNSASVQTQSQNSTEPPPERFNSVINFSNFLLHVLRVWTELDIPLDDKQLLEQFEIYIIRSDDSAQKVQEFTFALLKLKYLFDQYIIKREFSDGEDKWSLKRLYYYDAKSQNYINSFDDDGFKGNNRRILMLLSALHVSTPTPVYKHWLNGALYALYSMKSVTAVDYLQKLERLSRQFVYCRFLSPHNGAEYYEMIYRSVNYAAFKADNTIVLNRLKYGVIENNFVFNYLDYLIWCDPSTKEGYNDVINQFEFTFRSSVEHFSPQHPMEGHSPLPDEALHRFGNLCLISHSKNSRLSNFQPKAKRDHFQAAIIAKRIDTLKLYRMIQLMDDQEAWDELQIKTHESDMLSLLATDAQKGLAT